MPIKFLFLGGGGVLGFSGNANSIFMGVGIFPKLLVVSKQQNRTWTTSSTVLLVASELYSDKEIPFKSCCEATALLVGLSQLGIHQKAALSQPGTVHETVLGHLLRP